MIELLTINEVTGQPRWGCDAQSKAEFVLQAAKALLEGTLTIAQIETALVAAANEVLRLRNKRSRVRTIRQLQKEVSATAAMWYHELKRVSRSPQKLEQLVEQGGQGLTTLYRAVGPTQYHSPNHEGDAGLTPEPTTASRRSHQGSRIANVIEALMAALDKASPEQLAHHDADFTRAIAGLRQAQRTVSDQTSPELSHEQRDQKRKP
jgi:uncharacterized membrane protein YccC